MQRNAMNKQIKILSTIKLKNKLKYLVMAI